MPLQATSGAASYDAFGGGVAAVPNYIEDVFLTYLYTGNGSSQTITNGIDLSTKGGLVWIKNRTTAGTNNVLTDTARGAGFRLFSDTTAAQANGSGTPSFTSTGFGLATASSNLNASSDNYASWTFRKQPKFFDVVTYTGDGQDLRDIPHNLKARPGFIIIKRTDSTGDWFCAARSGNSGSDYVYRLLKLNSTAASAGSNSGNTDTTFNVGAVSYVYEASTDTNINGATYVAYLFAHNAGGFGLTGTDNVISCGSMVTSTPLVNVNLGYEPQWVMWKRTDATGNWGIADNMRGMPVSGDDQVLIPNLSNAESLATRVAPNATGFTFDGGVADGSTFIYIAIRRGPMKVPTSGTSVFAPVARAGTSTATTVTTGFPVDFIMSKGRNPSVGLGENWGEFDRLRGLAVLSSNNTGAEFTSPTYQLGIANFANNTGMNLSASDNDYGYINKSGYNYGTYFLRRAPSFFDEVCYTGTGTTTQQCSHNLGVQPELIIVRKRSAVQAWKVASTKMPNPYSSTNPWWDELYLNTTAAVNQGLGYIDNLATTTFTVAGATVLNQSGTTYVAYLFATCAGVSKVGNYTGTGTTKQIDCGFTGGARFVLIKRTDSTGDWYVWDTARGIVSGNDPYLLLNSTAAEVTSTDYIDTYSAGFEISSSAPSAINASGGTFIFLAIA